MHWYRRSIRGEQNLPLTVFNSTSVAAYTIARHIRSINSVRAAWRRLYEGQSSVESLNRTLKYATGRTVSSRQIINSIALLVTTGRLSELKA